MTSIICISGRPLKILAEYATAFKHLLAFGTSKMCEMQGNIVALLLLLRGRIQQWDGTTFRELGGNFLLSIDLSIC